MNAPSLRNTVFLGVFASVIGLVVWAIWKATGNQIAEFGLLIIKVILLFNAVFYVAKMAACVHGRPKRALFFGLNLLVAVFCAGAAYLPWREQIVRGLGDSTYRWYRFDISAEHPGFPGDIFSWQAAWEAGRPQLIEGCILIFTCVSLLTIAVKFKLGKAGICSVVLLGYLALTLLPFLGGLVAFDFDLFLKGIVLDSLAADLMPHGILFVGDYTAYTFVFMLLVHLIGTTVALPRFTERWIAVA